MRTLPWLLAAALSLAAAPTAAAEPWIPVPAGRLDAARGGFTIPGGLELSLGIERMVLINGQVVARTSIQIADLRAIGSAEAAHVREALASTTLVQNGAANVYSGEGAAGTFIQNSLNDQVIRTQTVISSTVNSSSLLKDLNFNQSMRDAAALQGAKAF